MNRKNGVIESILGILILALVGISLGMLYQRHPLHTSHHMLLKAEFESVDGLMEGSPVKIAGVIVGTVKSIRLNPKNYAALVTFSLALPLRLSKDTMAAVVSESLLSGKVMILSPGEDEAALVSGDTIFNTQSPMNLEQLLQKFLFSGGDHGDKEGKDHKGSENVDRIHWRTL